MGSSCTRDWTHVPCIGRRILNHCASREVPGKSFLSRGKRQSKSPKVCLLYSRNSKNANMAKTEWTRTGVKFKLVTAERYCVGCNLAVRQPDWSLWGLLHWVKYGGFEDIGAGKCPYLTYVLKGAQWLRIGNRVRILYVLFSLWMASIFNFSPFSVLHKISTSSL